MNEEQGTVRLSVDGCVAGVLLDRRHAHNAMTFPMVEQLIAICERLRGERSIRAATLRGAGGQAFVAGADIAQFARFTSIDDGIAYERTIERCIEAIATLPMPTVAIIDGFAVGGGLAIATACDFRIAVPAAQFGVPIARTLGNCLSVANVARLVDAFGSQRTKRMLLLAELIGAGEALACGYLHRVSAPETIDADAQALCASLAALAPLTQRASKEVLRRLSIAALPDAEELVRLCYGSTDFREGVAAFLAKRAPQWRGE